MTTKEFSYSVITPVRDEEEHIRSTIECMIKQTLLPKEWVIVDDGSKDETGKIIDKYASQYPWIAVVHRHDRGYRKAGGGVVDAFNDGYSKLANMQWDFLAKFDGDLIFEADYFEKCFEHFRQDPSELGDHVFKVVTEELTLAGTPLTREERRERVRGVGRSRSR